MDESGGSGQPQPDSESGAGHRPDPEDRDTTPDPRDGVARGDAQADGTPGHRSAEERPPAPDAPTGDAVPAPGAPRPPRGTATPDTPPQDVPAGPDAPGAPATPSQDVPGTPGAPAAPVTPDAPAAQGVPATPDTPATPEAPGTPAAPDAPGGAHATPPPAGDDDRPARTSLTKPHVRAPQHPYAHSGDPDRPAHEGQDAPVGGPPPAHTPGSPGHQPFGSGDAPAPAPGPGKARRPKEPGGGILMGRPFGVPVYVAPSWFLVAALITWVFGGQLDRVLPELGGLRYLVSLFFAVAFYASVLVHELAHTVAALRFKLPVRRIQLQFFGGVSEIEKESETPGREFVLAFVGPLLSLVLAALFYGGMLLVEPGTVPGVLLAGLMISNLIVAAFNLLPGLPLDGGRMLRAVVWKITGNPMSGTVAAAWVGRALAVAVLIGLPLLTHSGVLGPASEVNGMDTVTDALLAAILAAIIWTGAGNSLRVARLREHLPELRARTLTRRAVPVESATPLSEALRRANDAGARALVVVAPDGEPVAVVREAAIVGVPEHRRPWVAVSGLAQELTDGMRVSAELAGEELLDVLRATPATEYLVTEDSGEIYGVLSAADVERAFVKAMARPS
ncbi:site-2 protease family protein [Streptomyces uncialis]|uniref:site-2 protease family protein n=1 Tax=Streptomyces uncialis TaxID=1048205 RepID=UPI003868A670|nr:site-2 protease family protein [Streptomyces uncialis]